MVKQMLTYEQYKERITNVIRGYGFDITSPIIKYLIEVLTSHYYDTTLSNINLLMESSFLRSVNLNSKIAHSVDRGYSVYRGENQKVIFYNALAIKSFQIKKFDVLSSVAGLKLFSLKNYNIIEGNKYTIETIVGEDLITDSVVFTSQDIYKILDQSNLSETISIYDDNNVEQKITNKFPEIVFKDLLVQTYTDYSVVIFLKDLPEITKTYTIKSIKYTDKKIPNNSNINLLNFDLKNPIWNSTNKSDTTKTYIDTISNKEPERDPDRIFLYATLSFMSSGLVKSNSDVIGIISSIVLKEAIGTNVVINTTPLPQYPNGTITIYYVKNDNTKLSNNVKSEVRNTLKYSYLIKAKVIFADESPYPAEVISLKSEPFNIPSTDNTLIINGNTITTITGNNISAQDLINSIQPQLTNDVNITSENGFIKFYTTSIGSTSQITIGNGTANEHIGLQVNTYYGFDTPNILSGSVPVDYSLQLRIVYKDSININEVNNIITKYERIIGKVFSPFDIMSEISKMDNVIVVDSTTTNKIVLQPHERINFIQKDITYEFRVDTQ
jgi:hypothetical protein